MSSYEQRMQDTYAAATGVGWSAFAGLLLLASGAFDVIGGIALLAKNNHLASGLFWGRPFWGVVFLIVGGVTLYAGFGVLTQHAGLASDRDLRHHRRRLRGDALGRRAARRRTRPGCWSGSRSTC